MLIWPKEEKPCIWMDAGVINYKLCDRDYDCDHCLFNSIMKSSPSNGLLDTKSNNNLESEKAVVNTNPLHADQKAFDIYQKFRDFHFDPELYYGIDFWFFEYIDSNRARLGLNTLALTLLPPLKDIILAQPGSSLRAGQPICWIFTNSGSLFFNSPIDGQVSNLNPNILSSINSSRCNSKIWILEIFSKDLSLLWDQLLLKDKANAYLTQQQNDIISTFDAHINRYASELGVTLQDGGVMQTRLEDVFGPKRYFELISHLLRGQLF